MIYHVTTPAEWEAAQQSGAYAAASLSSEGFIHLSQEHQVAGVLDRYYQGMKDLVLLHVQEELLSAPLKFELSPSIGEEFPHVYGLINLDAVVKVTPIES